jgi:hypothetical protein
MLEGKGVKGKNGAGQQAVNGQIEHIVMCDDLKMDTGNLCDDPLYKAIDALYNRGWTDYHRSNRHDPRGTREWQTILDMFRLQKRQLENKYT